MGVYLILSQGEYKIDEVYTVIRVLSGLWPHLFNVYKYIHLLEL